MQVIAGPRQVGKSTLMLQVLRDVTTPYSLENADRISPDITLAIEVKSGRRKMNSGLPKFKSAFQPTHSFVVGTGGIPLETFLSCSLEDLVMTQ